MRSAPCAVACATSASSTAVPAPMPLAAGAVAMLLIRQAPGSPSGATKPTATSSSPSKAPTANASSDSSAATCSSVWCGRSTAWRKLRVATTDTGRTTKAVTGELLRAPPPPRLGACTQSPGGCMHPPAGRRMRRPERQDASCPFGSNRGLAVRGERLGRRDRASGHQQAERHERLLTLACDQLLGVGEEAVDALERRRECAGGGDPKR